MAGHISLEIVTRQRRVVAADVDEVRLPGVLGELGVLPGHTPLLTSLAIGRVAYTEGGREHKVLVEAGFAEVQPDRVTVLAREARLPEEIDVAAEREVLAQAMAELKTVAAADFDEVNGRLRAAEAALEIAGHN